MCVLSVVFYNFSAVHFLFFVISLFKSTSITALNTQNDLSPTRALHHCRPVRQTFSSAPGKGAAKFTVTHPAILPSANKSPTLDRFVFRSAAIFFRFRFNWAPHAIRLHLGRSPKINCARCSFVTAGYGRRAHWSVSLGRLSTAGRLNGRKCRETDNYISIVAHLHQFIPSTHERQRTSWESSSATFAVCSERAKWHLHVFRLFSY